MKDLFVEYPKCSTCQKAKKWLQEKSVSFDERHIVEKNPTKQELKKWISTSQMDTKKWFNTSGLKYKELKLKDRLVNMSDEEKIDLLATDGMLVKRPILITEKGVCPGFKEDIWKELVK